MAAWTEAQRVTLRRLVGASAIWLQANPYFENALTAVLAIADGGTRPDDSTQQSILALMNDALTIETNLKTLWSLTFVSGRQDEGTIDPARGLALLRAEGRRIVHSIAIAFAMNGVIRDVFSGVRVVDPEAVFDADLTRTR